MCMVCIGSGSIFFHMDIQLTYRHLLKRQSFPTELWRWLCHKSGYNIHVGLFLESVIPCHWNIYLHANTILYKLLQFGKKFLWVNKSSTFVLLKISFPTLNSRHFAFPCGHFGVCLPVSKIWYFLAYEYF